MKRWLPALLVLYVALGLWLLGQGRAPLGQLWGDEDSYTAMALSLAQDHDLRFDLPDLSRASPDRGSGSGGGEAAGGIILQRVAHGIYYSKPILYPLIGAPLVALFGRDGLLLLNALALGMGLLMAWRFLRTLGEAGHASLTLITFAGTGTLLPYLVWRMPECLETALVLIALSLLCGTPPAATGSAAGMAGERIARVVMGGALLGLVGSMRLPNIGIAFGCVVLLALRRRMLAALLAASAAIAAWALLFALTAALAGTGNPYRAERTSFDASIGFPVGPDASAVLGRFQSNSATNVSGIIAWQDSALIAYDAVYFAVGRHAGVAIYLPFILPLLWTVARRRERGSLGLVLGVAALAGFYLYFMRDNWFGGATAIGNRYFLPGYAALLYALPALPSLRALVVAWIIASLALGSGLLSQARVAGRDAMSQVHAYAGVFRWLPYETTASDIDGRRDRYWSGHFLRFVDPFAVVGEREFRLRSGDPAAEIVVASPPGETGPFRLSVAGEPEGLPFRLEVDEFGGNEQFDVAGHAVLDLKRHQVWRRHSFWWPPPVRYQVRTLRLAVHSRDGDAVTVRLRWLGAAGSLERAFEVERHSVILPREVVAGETFQVSVRGRNLSPLAWSDATPFEVRLAARWLRGEADGPMALESPHHRLEPPVPASGVLDQVIDLRAPDESGRYRLRVDLLAEDVGWFGAINGRALAEQLVDVTDRSSPPQEN